MYLDYNATTPLDTRVLEAMLPYMQGCFGNPSSVHRYGRLARNAIDRAREQVAALVGVHPTQVIFTGSGTEANNLAIWGRCAGADMAESLAVSAIEHPSVRNPALALRSLGHKVIEVPVSSSGVVELESMASILQTKTTMVSVMLANNETGAIQPIAELAQLARAHGAIIHTDASQAVGKIAVNFDSLGAHLMTLSAHKCYGPLGAGALIVDKSVALQPQTRGGGQERGLRPGTENIAAIVGFGCAAELAQREWADWHRHMLSLRQQLEVGLKSMSDIKIFAGDADRLPNTVQFGVLGLHGETTLMKLDCKGLAISSGSACRAGSAEPSHVLTAMGVDSQLALTAVRVSLGKETTQGEIERFLSVIGDVVHDPLRNAAVA